MLPHSENHLAERVIKFDPSIIPQIQRLADRQGKTFNDQVNQLVSIGVVALTRALNDQNVGR